MNKITFKTNCGFFLSRYDGKFFKSDKPYLEPNIREFLEDNFEKGIEITIKILKSKPQQKAGNGIKK